MGDFAKHITMAREKMGSVREAYTKKRYAVVGDLAIKVGEHLVEADAARVKRHLGGHRQRQNYSKATFPPEIWLAICRLYDAYGDLGYDGTNGGRAQVVMNELWTVVEFFEGEFGERITGAQYRKGRASDLGARAGKKASGG